MTGCISGLDGDGSRALDAFDHFVADFEFTTAAESLAFRIGNRNGTALIELDVDRPFKHASCHESGGQADVIAVEYVDVEAAAGRVAFAASPRCNEAV